MSNNSSSHVLYESKDEEAQPAKQMFYIELEGSKCLTTVSDKQKETREGDREALTQVLLLFRRWVTDKELSPT